MPHTVPAIKHSGYITANGCRSWIMSGPYCVDTRSVYWHCLTHLKRVNHAHTITHSIIKRMLPLSVSPPVQICCQISIVVSACICVFICYAAWCILINLKMINKYFLIMFMALLVACFLFRFTDSIAQHLEFAIKSKNKHKFAYI